MTDPRNHDFEDELRGGMDEEEREQLIALARQLSEGRPVPSARLRSAIHTSLLGGKTIAQPSRVRTLIFGYATSGALLLIIAVAGLAGIGPFAA
jgi:hypothetical protein